MAEDNISEEVMMNMRWSQAGGELGHSRQREWHVQRS